MPGKKKVFNKNAAYRERDKAAGIGRRDIYIDDKTYTSLMKLLGHAGYDTSKDREVKQGISGVLLHLISIASQKTNIDKIIDKKSYQQKVLLARIANTLLKSDGDEYGYEDVATIWNQYEVGRKTLRDVSTPKGMKRKVDDFISEYLNKKLPYK